MQDLRIVLSLPDFFVVFLIAILIARNPLTIPWTFTIFNVFSSFIKSLAPFKNSWMWHNYITEHHHTLPYCVRDFYRSKWSIVLKMHKDKCVKHRIDSSFLSLYTTVENYLFIPRAAIMIHTLRSSSL